MRACVFVGLWLVAGCAQTPDAIRAREAERMQRARCASVELYQFGIAPAKRYRIVGPISVEGDNIPTHTDRALQQQACALGADGVIDIREAAPPVGDLTLERRSTVSGTAIAFIADEPPPAPPPQ